jgi:hypothetical protein
MRPNIHDEVYYGEKAIAVNEIVNTNVCQKCGKPLFDDHKSTAVQDTCKGHPEDKPFTPVPIYGWTCPVCGRGNSPQQRTCPCKPIPNEITF